MKTIDDKSSDKEIQLAIFKNTQFIAKYLQERETTAEDIGLISNAKLLKALDISEITLREMRNDGSLPYRSFGRKIFYRISDIYALFQKRPVEKQELAPDFCLENLTAGNNH